MVITDELQSRVAELEALQRRSEQIAGIQTALSAATNEQEILAAVAAVAESYGAVGSALAYTETDAEGDVVASAKVVAMQFGGQSAVIADVLPTDDYPLDANPILKIALDTPDEPLFVENIFTDPRAKTGVTREAFRHTGMTATVILWFRSAGRMQGVMTFNWPGEQPFNEDMRAVFKAVQPVAAAVISNRRLILDMEQRVAERTAAMQASEQRLAQAQQAGGIGVWELDLQTSQLYWSDTMYELTRRDPALGAPGGDEHFDMIVADDRELMNNAVAEAVQNGVPFKVDYRITRNDGAVRYVTSSGYATYNDAGQLTKLIGTMQDLTDRKQAADALRQSQRMLQTVLDTIPVRVFWKDADSRFLGCNRLFAEDMGGAAPEDVIGKTDYDFAAATHADSYRADDLKVMQSQQPRLNYEERLTRGDGTDIWLRTSKIPLLDNNGQAVGILGVFDDITISKQAEAERDRLQQQIIESQRQALVELSTPIIPIMDRIIVMPLVGGIDTTRARDIMRSLLAGISQYRAQIAILDITGVPVVDSGVADHLNRTIQAARLKGAQTIITGVSDAVAETIVDLGIDWSSFETLRDLQTGLVTALERVGVRLVQRSPGDK